MTHGHLLSLTLVSVGVLLRWPAKEPLPEFWMWPRHTPGDEADPLEFPGGKIEGHETPWQALRRELEEEVELKVCEHQCQLFKIHPHRYPDKKVLLYIFLVDLSDYRAPWREPSGQWFQLTAEEGSFPTPILAANRDFLKEILQHFQETAHAHH